MVRREHGAEQLLLAMSVACSTPVLRGPASGAGCASAPQTAVEHVLPHQRLRQFVLTFPFELRARLAYDRELLSRVTKLFNDCVLGFYRRTLRDLYRAGSGQGGTITVTQRTSSDLRLNPHLHQLALDGVFVEEDSGALVFR